MELIVGETRWEGDGVYLAINACTHVKAYDQTTGRVRGSRTTTVLDNRNNSIPNEQYFQGIGIDNNGLLTD